MDALLQVVREVEGLCRLESVVPQELLWDRPTGLPSGVELLWLIHLIDSHVFIPTAEQAPSSLSREIPQPDYLGLLAEYPCTAGSLEHLLERIHSSRETLVRKLNEIVTSGQVPAVKSDRLIEIIISHDRRLLASFAERLYESGLGA